MIYFTALVLFFYMFYFLLVALAIYVIFEVIVNCNR